MDPNDYWHISVTELQARLLLAGYRVFYIENSFGASWYVAALGGDTSLSSHWSWRGAAVAALHDLPRCIGTFEGRAVIKDHEGFVSLQEGGYA